LTLLIVVSIARAEPAPKAGLANPQRYAANRARSE
jgi:hypothetical protein